MDSGKSKKHNNNIDNNNNNYLLQQNDLKIISPNHNQKIIIEIEKNKQNFFLNSLL